MQKTPVRSPHRSPKLLAFASAAVLLGLLAGCGSQGAAPSPSPSSQPLEGPEATLKLYRASCISCHGSELQGKMGPESDLRHVGASLTKEQILQQIENGGSLMPAFKDRLKPEEIDAIADWLAGLK